MGEKDTASPPVCVRSKEMEKKGLERRSQSGVCAERDRELHVQSSPALAVPCTMDRAGWTFNRDPFADDTREHSSSSWFFFLSSFCFLFLFFIILSDPSVIQTVEGGGESNFLIVHFRDIRLYGNRATCPPYYSLPFASSSSSALLTHD